MTNDQLIRHIENRDRIIARHEAQIKRLCAELPNTREYVGQTDSERQLWAHRTNQIAKRIDALKAELAILSKM